MEAESATYTAAEMAEMEFRVEEIEEALIDAQRILAADEIGWRRLGDFDGNETLPREDVKAVIQRARVMALSNPLIRRGVELHVAYVWGQGCTIIAKQEDSAEQDVNAVVQAFLDDPSNVKTFTGAQAREQMERTLKTDGEMFHSLWTSPLMGRVQVRKIPTFQIQEIITNPEDEAEVWFYKRVYSPKRVIRGALGTTTTTSQTETVYYPDVSFRPAVRPRSIDDHKIHWDAPVIHTFVNESGGRGTPDVLSALPWALGYKGFLEDWAKLIKALSRFAFRATAKNRAGAAATRSTIATRALDTTGQPGATVITGEDQKFEAIGKSGATIDSESGRPLAAMVAAGLNIPVTMLLADPGVTGARATAETLDAPLHMIIKGRRTLFADLYREVLAYVIRECVRAPRGALKGSVLRDVSTGREVVTLRGEQEAPIEVNFPSIEKTDAKTLMEAISKADSLDKLPPLLLAKLAMLALGVEDVDDWMSEISDDDGNFVSPVDAAAATAQQNAVRDGNLPPEQ